MATLTGDNVESATTDAAVSRGLNERRAWPVLVILLLAVDFAFLFAAATLAYQIRFFSAFFGFKGSGISHPHFYLKAQFLYSAMSVVLFAIVGAYRRRGIFSGTAEYQQILYATGLATLLTEFGIYLADRHYQIARGWLMLAWLLGAGLVIAWRFSSRRLLRVAHRWQLLVQPALVVGIGREGQILEWHIHRAKYEGIRIVGFVDADAPIGQEVVGGLPVVGHIDDLPELIDRYQIDQVFVATADFTPQQSLNILQHVLPSSADLALAPDLFRTLTTEGRLRRIAGDALLVVDKVRITGLDAVLKNIFDLTIAVTVLLITAPVWIAIAVAITVTSRGPLFTRHRTLGAAGRPFNALKFRTTCWPPRQDASEEYTSRWMQGLPIRERPDITRFGRVLSRYSLDELPQLLNVLWRQMSLVGPYKISPDHVRLYGGRQLALFTVRPGITGVCQIYGRGELTVEERSLLDAEYVRTYTIWRDIQIVLASIPAVLHGRGAY